MDQEKEILISYVGAGVSTGATAGVLSSALARRWVGDEAVRTRASSPIWNTDFTSGNITSIKQHCPQLQEDYSNKISSKMLFRLHEKSQLECKRNSFSYNDF